MCMEDVRLARRSYSRVMSGTVAAGQSVQILGVERDRISLLMHLTAAGTGFLRLAFNNDTAGSGIPIAGSQWPLQLRLQHDGDLCRAPLTVQAIGGDVTFYTVASYLDQQ